MAPNGGPPLRDDLVDPDLDPDRAADRAARRPPLPSALAAARDGLAGSLAGWRERLGGRLPLDGRLVGWVVTVVVAAAVSWWLLRPAAPPFEETLPHAGTVTTTEGDGTPDPVAGDPGPTTSTAPTEVVAHAAGAVNAPGVYRLPVGARVDDLVRAAGGLAPDADPQRINLAAPLADGSRLYVPRIGEPDPPAVVGPDGGAPAPGTGGDGGTGDGPGALVDLNTAGEDELDTLPGVGPATAAAIVTFRDENGPFAAVDELLDVPGIGEAKLEQIRPLVTV